MGHRRHLCLCLRPLSSPSARDGGRREKRLPMRWGMENTIRRDDDTVKIDQHIDIVRNDENSREDRHESLRVIAVRCCKDSQRTKGWRTRKGYRDGKQENKTRMGCCALPEPAWHAVLAWGVRVEGLWVYGCVWIFWLFQTKKSTQTSKIESTKKINRIKI